MKKKNVDMTRSRTQYILHSSPVPYSLPYRLTQINVD